MPTNSFTVVEGVAAAPDQFELAAVQGVGSARGAVRVHEGPGRREGGAGEIIRAGRGSGPEGEGEQQADRRPRY